MVKALALILAWVATAAGAAGEPVLVTMVRDGVSIEGAGGGKTALVPFVRLHAGDRVTLPAQGQVSMVFVAGGRQETWQGSGVVLVADSEGKPVSGKPQVQIRQIPAEVARQMNRTPIVSADGHVGMIRLRSIQPSDTAARLENDYRELQNKAAADDINPEIYFLAGLFDLRQYDRIDEELKRIAGSFADNPALPGLQQLYSRALANARQPRQ